MMVKSWGKNGRAGHLEKLLRLFVEEKNSDCTLLSFFLLCSQKPKEQPDWVFTKTKYLVLSHISLRFVMIDGVLRV